MKAAVLAMSIILCMFILSCDKKTTEPDPVVPAKLCGRVTHSVYGYPLNETWIGTIPYLNYSGPIGTYSGGKFCLSDLEPGLWEVFFNKYGYLTDTLLVTLTEGESLYVDVGLSREIPEAGKAFYFPWIPWSEQPEHVDTNPPTGCIDYPDSLVIWARQYWSAYLSAYITYYQATVILKKPVSLGTIDLTISTLGYVEYRIWSTIWNEAVGDTIISTTALPDGGGQIQVLGYDPMNHTIEGIQSDVVYSNGTGNNTSLSDCDFIGHW